MMSLLKLCKGIRVRGRGWKGGMKWGSIGVAAERWYGIASQRMSWMQKRRTIIIESEKPNRSTYPRFRKDRRTQSAAGCCARYR